MSNKKNRRVQDMAMRENTRTVEAIFWDDKDSERWQKAVDVLKSVPFQQAEQIMVEAKRMADEQQTFYGLKDACLASKIKANSKRIKEISSLTMTWVRS